MFRLVEIPETKNRVFMIVRKDAMAGDVYKTLPVEVYGFLKVVGDSYENSFVARKNMADEVYRFIVDLEQEVLLKAFQIDQIEK